MKKIISILIVAACAIASTAVGASYSTEATITRLKDGKDCLVDVRISRLVEQNGSVTEELISEPRLQTSPGIPVRFDPGLQPADAKNEKVSVDVFWPTAGNRDFPVCEVVVKLGGKIVSKTKIQLKVDEK